MGSWMGGGGGGELSALLPFQDVMDKGYINRKNRSQDNQDKNLAKIKENKVEYIEKIFKVRKRKKIFFLFRKIWLEIFFSFTLK